MTRQCEMCPESNPKPATIYCPADSCYLCAACDHEVHSANRLASRHVRRQLVVDDITDGSSINDDSDARVPDVSSSTTTETATREAVNIPTKTSNNKEQAMDVDVNTQFPSLNDVSVTFEDAAEYDFCFDSIAPRMAPLAGADDENNLFSDGKLAKSFYPDLSWDSVVSDAFEHVVPDVEVCTPNDMVDTTRFSTNRTRESTRRTARCIKAEKIEVKVEDQLSVKLENRIDTEVQGQSSSPKRGLGPKSSAEISSSALTLKKDGKTVGLGGKRDKKELYASQISVKRSNEMNVEKIGGIGEGVEDKVKMYEQRKKRRMEALARFRSKRANRSFTKKVRYECRKQLADSRPRVKGRFVRKVEMALFRKYGAMYRDHLDELKEQSQDRRIPLL